jgi:hypothetical protein
MFLRAGLPLLLIAVVLGFAALEPATSGEPRSQGLTMAQNFGNATAGTILSVNNSAFRDTSKIKAVISYQDPGFAYFKMGKVLPRRDKEDRDEMIEVLIRKLRRTGYHTVDFYVRKSWVGSGYFNVPEPEQPWFQREVVPQGDWVLVFGRWWGNEPPTVWMERDLVGANENRRYRCKVCNKNYSFISRPDDGLSAFRMRIPRKLPDGYYRLYADTMMGPAPGYAVVEVDSDADYEYPLEPPPTNDF